MRAESLLRLYPRAWRERYGEEFLAMLGDEPLRLAQAIDVVAGAVDAWTSGEVRRATRAGGVGTGNGGGSAMTKKLIPSCGGAVLAPTRRDEMLGALAMIGGTLVFTAAGVAAKRGGLDAFGDTLLSVAFFAGLLLMTPFLYLRERSWRVQLALVGLPLAVLVGIAALVEALT